MKYFVFAALLFSSVAMAQPQRSIFIFSCKLKAQTVPSKKTLSLVVSQKFGRPMTSEITVDGVKYTGSGEYNPSGLWFVSNENGNWNTAAADWNLLKGRSGKFYLVPMNEAGEGAEASYACIIEGANG